MLAINKWVLWWLWDAKGFQSRQEWKGLEVQVTRYKIDFKSANLRDNKYGASYTVSSWAACDKRIRRTISKVASVRLWRSGIPYNLLFISNWSIKAKRMGESDYIQWTAQVTIHTRCTHNIWQRARSICVPVASSHWWARCKDTSGGLYNSDARLIQTDCTSATDGIGVHTRDTLCICDWIWWILVQHVLQNSESHGFMS
jgi:hypothetical protein